MSKIGNFLVKEGLITQEQLNQVVAIQKRQKSYTPIGEILVYRKIISRTTLEQVLKKYQKSIPIGELLLNMKVITPEQLEKALAKQKEKREKLGKILVDMNAIDENTLVNALSMQLGIPKIIPSINLIDTSLLKKFNPGFLQKHRFIPAYKEKNILTVIMADPLDRETVRFLEEVLKCQIKPAIASPSEIQNTIALYYQKRELGEELQASESVKDLVIGETDLVREKKDQIVEIVNFIISTAITDQATDIHIEPQDGFLRVRYRIDGILHHKTDLPNYVAQKLISRIKAICGLDIAEKRKHQDGRIQARIMRKEYDLRVSTYAAIWGENVVIRILTRENNFVELESIGFTPVNLVKHKDMLDRPTGITLVTGPTGSGKSTTLYASLQYLNKLDRVIITVEDPVEYTIDGIVQASLAPKVGINYTDYLRAMMRQDPDVLMIGEIRDAEAAEAVIQASLTGHKALSTLHTEDATGALLRLGEMGIEPFLVSSTIVSVIAQRLVRKLCQFCKEKSMPSKKTFSFFHTIKDKESSGIVFYKPVGCMHCKNTGYKGMTAIHELLIVNDAVREEVLKRSPNSVIKAVARQHAGLVTMSEDGFYKALKGITSLEDVVRVVYRDDSQGVDPISVEELIDRCENTAKWTITDDDE